MFYLKSILQNFFCLIFKIILFFLLLMIRFSSIDGKLVIRHGSSHSDNPILREAAFKVFNSPNPESEQLLDSLLECRHKLALTCGFPSYAHR